MNDETIRFTREQLYKKVWSKPVSGLAKEWGISDVGLAKICRRYNIPRPGLGYWRRKELGYRVKQIPLPKWKGPEMIEIRPHSAQPEVYDEQQAKEGEEIISSEKLPENRIRVPETLIDPHPLIDRTQKSLQSAKRDERGLVRPRAKATLSVVVAPPSIERAMRIMDALLKNLELRDMKVTIESQEIENRPNSMHGGNGWRHIPVAPIFRPSKTMVSVLGELLEICLEEKVDRKERQLDQQNSGKHQDSYSYRRPEYDYFPTGHLSLSIKDVKGVGIRHTYSDAKKKRLENLLNPFIASLINAAVDRRACRLERERREREWEEQRRKGEEEEQLRREEERRLKILDEQVSNWHKSQKIRQFVEAVKKMALWKHGSIEPGSRLDKWITWAIRQANKLDPLIMSFSSMSDKPEPSWQP